MASLVLASGQTEAARLRFRRVLGISAIVHTLLILVFVFFPPSQPPIDAMDFVTVDLISALPGEPAPMPKAGASKAVQASKPKPAPTEPATPKLPVQDKVVLPTTPTDPKVADAKPTKPEPAKSDEKSYEDVLDSLRAEAGSGGVASEADAAATGAAHNAAQTAVGGMGTGGGGAGVRASPEVLAWLKQARIRVRQNWVVAPGHRFEPFETRVIVDIDENGTVRGEPEIVKGSGNPWFDDGVVRAIRKASPLPPPPEAGRWPFVFRLEDE